MPSPSRAGGHRGARRPSSSWIRWPHHSPAGPPRRSNSRPSQPPLALGLKQTPHRPGPAPSSPSPAAASPCCGSSPAWTLALGPLGSQPGQGSPLTPRHHFRQPTTLDFLAAPWGWPLHPGRHPQAAGAAAHPGTTLPAGSAAHQRAEGELASRIKLPLATDDKGH